MFKDIILIKISAECPINLVLITNCYDGDTCYYKENPKAQSIPIRLMNIDTPEIKGECQEEITKAIKARDRVNQLIRDSRNIKVDIYYTDKYNRYVGYIWLDSINLNTILLGEELAKPYKRNIDWCK